jgi:hypothetical protein
MLGRVLGYVLSLHLELLLVPWRERTVDIAVSRGSAGRDLFQLLHQSFSSSGKGKE